MNPHKQAIGFLEKIPSFRDSQGHTLRQSFSAAGFDLWEANANDLCFDPRFHSTLYDAAFTAICNTAAVKYSRLKARVEGAGMAAWRIKRLLSAPPFEEGKASVAIMVNANTFVPVAVPIYRALCKKGVTPLIVTYETPANRKVEKDLSSRGVPFTPIESFIDEETAGNTATAWSSLQKSWSLLKRDRVFTGNFEIGGRNFWKEAERVFNYFFETRKRARETLEFYAAFENALKKTGCSNVIVFDDVTANGKACVQAARNTGGSSFAVQHGVLTTPEISACSSADEFMVFGEADKRFLLKAGVKKVAVVGNPKYDRLKELNQEQCKKKFGLQGRVLLHTAQPLGTGYESARRAIVKVGKKLGATVVFKLHPLDNPADYEEFRKEGAKILQNVDVFEAIVASDVVITINSSTAVDAVAAGKPVIITNFNNWEEFWPGGKMLL
ncbi:MAG: hypothetical protein V1811_02275, partial [Candidatus Micrarchaeota archaeon]